MADKNLPTTGRLPRTSCVVRSGDDHGPDGWVAALELRDIEGCGLGLEGAFRRFDGVPQEVVFDNARALVDYHDAATREVRFNERLHGTIINFASQSATRPISSCADQATLPPPDPGLQIPAHGAPTRGHVGPRKVDVLGALFACDPWRSMAIDRRVMVCAAQVPLCRAQSSLSADSLK